MIRYLIHHGYGCYKIINQFTRSNLHKNLKNEMNWVYLYYPKIRNNISDLLNYEQEFNEIEKVFQDLWARKLPDENRNGLFLRLRKSWVIIESIYGIFTSHLNHNYPSHIPNIHTNTTFKGEKGGEAFAKLEDLYDAISLIGSNPEKIERLEKSPTAISDIFHFIYSLRNPGSSSNPYLSENSYNLKGYEDGNKNTNLNDLESSFFSSIGGGSVEEDQTETLTISTILKNYYASQIEKDPKVLNKPDSINLINQKYPESKLNKDPRFLYDLTMDLLNYITGLTASNISLIFLIATGID